ncbi:NUDIX hydrolase [Candidatus Nanosalina sp. VS9-1]|uniref:NUDIX hydrolase n=1 Tax=Candidatus Nanosalina sp. VS9-1 TaxID=3388566 RepID=UPI0039E03091
MDRIALLIRRDEEFLVVNDEDSKEGEWRPIIRQIEKGETLREAARNETRSVTGVEIEFVEKVTKTEIGSGNERIHWYLVDEESATEENPEPEKVDVENENYDWFTAEEIQELELGEKFQNFFEEHGETLVEK